MDDKIHFSPIFSEEKIVLQFFSPDKGSFPNVKLNFDEIC